MAVDAMTRLTQAPKDASNPGYRIEGDKVINDAFLDGFTFWDALDVINPLQHIPVVSSVYRELTGDTIKAGPRLAGGVLFGGVAGLVGAALNVVSKELTGKDLGEHAVAMVEMAFDGDEKVRTAQINAPSGQANSAQALTRDPKAPLDLLPPRWRMAANGGPNTGGRALAGTTLGEQAVTTQGTAPANLPLGDGALAPLGGIPISPSASSPSKPTPGRVDVILPKQAAAMPSRQGNAQIAGRAPVNPPLGDDALGGTSPIANAQANAQTAALQNHTATSRLPRSLSETREFSGRTLADYRNRPIRSNAGRSTSPTASKAVISTPSTAQVNHPNPAAMAQLLDAQASARSASVNRALDNVSSNVTSEGDVLRVAESPSKAATAATTTTTTTMKASEAAGMKQDAWFAQKMLMGLEKYQKARGGLPLNRGNGIDA